MREWFRVWRESERERERATYQRLALATAFLDAAWLVEPMDDLRLFRRFVHDLPYVQLSSFFANVNMTSSGVCLVYCYDDTTDELTRACQP